MSDRPRKRILEPVMNSAETGASSGTRQTGESTDRGRFRQRHPFPRLPENFFRPEAVEHYREQPSRPGDVLRIAPTWTRWFYWLLVAIFTGSLIFVMLGRLGEYAEGPAIVRLDGQMGLTAKQSGVVSSVRVQPKDPVGAGQPLVSFYDAQESAELERARLEYDVQLVGWLRNPTDLGARQGLASLKGRVAHAQAQLEERVLRAPHEGIVSDIRIKEGQPVIAGEVVMMLAEKESLASVVAMLPGHFRPMLKPGMPLRLEISGFPHADLQLTVDSVDDQVIGPGAVRRSVGQEIADTVASSGPVVLVRARLPGVSFEADGKTYVLHDGMHGTAQIGVRRESLLVALVPQLKIFENQGE